MFRLFEFARRPLRALCHHRHAAHPAVALPARLSPPSFPGHGLDHPLGPRRGGDRDLADLVRRPHGRRPGRHASRRGLDPSRPRAGGRSRLHPAGAPPFPDRQRGPSQPVADAQCRHHRPLAQQPACPAPVGGVVPERLRRPHRQPDDADRPRRGRGDVPDLRRRGLRGRLPDRRALAAERHRPAPRPAALGLARLLPLAGCLDDPARWQGVQGLLRCPLGDHRADRRQLHQHPVGEALRPHPHRGGLRHRGDRARAQDLHGANAHHHPDGPRPDRHQRLSHRSGDRLRPRPLAAGHRQHRHRRRRLGAGAAAQRHDRLDHVVAVVVVPEHRRHPRGHGDDLAAHPPDRRPQRAGARPDRG